MPEIVPLPAFAMLMAYREHEKLAPLVREIAWAQNLAIMSTCNDQLTRKSK